MIKKAAESDKQKRRLGKGLALASGLIVLLMVLMGVMMAVMLDAFKDTQASGAMFTTREGAVMQTTPATYSLPLIVAPVLEQEKLAEIRTLTVGYLDPYSDQPR